MRLPTVTAKVEASGSKLNGVVCEHCGNPYFYMLRRTASGEGEAVLGINYAGAKNEATQQAQNRLKEALSDIDPIACPACGNYQADMIVRLKRMRYGSTSVLSVLCFVFAALAPFVLFLMDISQRARSHIEWDRFSLSLFSIYTYELLLTGLALYVLWRIQCAHYFPNDDAKARAEIEPLSFARRKGKGPFSLAEVQEMAAASVDPRKQGMIAYALADMAHKTQRPFKKPAPEFKQMRPSRTWRLQLWGVTTLMLTAILPFGFPWMGEEFAFRRAASSGDKLEGMDAYIKDYPQGRHLDAVLQLRDDRRYSLAANAAKLEPSLAPLRDYLKVKDNTRHRTEAEALINTLFDESITKVKALSQRPGCDAKLIEALVALIEPLRNGPERSLTIAYARDFQLVPATGQARTLEKMQSDLLIKKNPELKTINDNSGGVIVNASAILGQEATRLREIVVTDRVRHALNTALGGAAVDLTDAPRDSSPDILITYKIRPTGDLYVLQDLLSRTCGLARSYSFEWTVTFRARDTLPAYSRSFPTDDAFTFMQKMRQDDLLSPHMDPGFYTAMLHASAYKFAAQLEAILGNAPAKVPTAFSVDGPEADNGALTEIAPIRSEPPLHQPMLDSQESRVPALRPQQNPKETVLEPPENETLDEAKCYTHPGSGIKFYYPKGWQVGSPKQTGPITSMPLSKDNGALQVTLYFRPPDSETSEDEERVMMDSTALAQIYGDKLSEAETIKVKDQIGYRIKINGPPILMKNAKLVGVCYLFFIHSETTHKTCTVKIRASAKDQETLEAVEELPFYLRWK
jgi:hypothetical protein